jgi:hypothetical protein
MDAKYPDAMDLVWLIPGFVCNFNFPDSATE